MRVGSCTGGRALIAARMEPLPSPSVAGPAAGVVPAAGCGRCCCGPTRSWSLPWAHLSVLLLPVLGAPRNYRVLVLVLLLLLHVYIIILSYCYIAPYASLLLQVPLLDWCKQQAAAAAAGGGLKAGKQLMVLWCDQPHG